MRPVDGLATRLMKAQMDHTTHRIVVEPFLRLTKRGERWVTRAQRYRVWFRGEVLIQDTWNPTFEAARQLVALRHQGRFEIWRPNGAYPCVTGDLVTAAALTSIAPTDTTAFLTLEMRFVTVTSRLWTSAS